MAACTECGTTLPRSATACPQCGTPVARRVTKAAAKPAAKPAKKAAAKPAEPAKPAKKAAAKPAAKRAAKAVAPEPPAEPVADVAAPSQRRRPALAADGSAARRRALQGTLPSPVPPPVAEPAAGSDVVGEAAERDPYDTFVPSRPSRLVDSPAVAEDGGEPPRFAVRVLSGDWLAAVRDAAPAVVTVLVLAALATVAVMTATRPGSDELLVEGTGAGRWLRYVCVAVGLAFGSPLSMSMSGGEESFFPGDYSLGFVPLTVTFAALAVLWLRVRAGMRAGRFSDWLADGVRTAAVFAFALAVVSVLGRWSVTETRPGFDDSGFDDPGFEGSFGVAEETTTTSFSVWPPKVFFWAFLAALAVVALAHLTRSWPSRWAAWGVVVRGALVGVGAGVALSFVAALVLAYANADRVDASASDVTGALPALLAYLPNLGTAAFGVVSGGRLGASYGEQASVTLWSSWLPDGYLLLFVIPVLAVAAGARYVTRRSGLPPAESARACARMALPAGLAWGVLAIAGSAHTSVVFGGGRTGPRLWDALLVALWFGVLGWLAGRALAGRQAPAFDQPDTPPVP